YIQVDSMCPVKALALSDIAVQGSISGDYTRTFSIDGNYEVLYEVVQGQRSQLDHRWDFDVAPGPAVTFRVEAFRYTSTDGDDFEFQYSTDNVNFTTVATATAYGYFSATVPLPATLSGTVYVRLRDTDRTQGNTTTDQIMVNYLAIESAVDPPPHPCEAISGLRFMDKEEMQWDAAASATSYDIVWGDLSALRLNGSVGDAVCGWDDHSGTSMINGTDPPAGSSYYYLIRGDDGGLPAGTYDNVPGPALPEERDAEIGTAGGGDCSSTP
ncbi:MAG: discoidin domain-containing protein, partial [Acidobacteriota bacterium]|nr:discoidin domain-containing protein [Acidobacteriota bacterium]